MVSNCPLKTAIVNVQFIDGKFVRANDNYNDNDNDGGDRRNLRGENVLRRISHQHHVELDLKEEDLLPRISRNRISRLRKRNLSRSRTRHIKRILDNDNGFDNNTDNNNDESIVYKAKECPCAISATPTYCIYTSSNENLCDVRPDGRTLCYHATAYSHVLLNSWPVVVLWYAAVVLYVLFTDGGRGMIKYAWRMATCKDDGYARDLVGDILEREEAERRRVEERERISRRRDNVTYVLKTKEYCSKPERGDGNSDSHGGPKKVLERSPSECTLPSTPGSLSTSSSPTFSDQHDDVSADSLIEEPIEPISSSSPIEMPTAIQPICLPCIQPNQTTSAADTTDLKINTGPSSLDDPYIDSDEDEDCETCTICILAIKDGDRIGALRCDHKFHVACLSEWIKRRNVCPLCQSPDIADVRRSPEEPTNGTSGGGPIVTRRTTSGTTSSPVAGRSFPPRRTTGRGGTGGGPPTRSTVARIRRLREARREAVRTRLFSGSGTTRRFPGSSTSGTAAVATVPSSDGGGEGRRIPTVPPPDSVRGGPGVTAVLERLGVDGTRGDGVTTGSDGSRNGAGGARLGWETVVESGDGTTRPITRVSTDRHSSGRRRVRHVQGVSSSTPSAYF